MEIYLCFDAYDFSFVIYLSDHGEGLQILHYEVGQKYEPHFDYFMDEYNTKNGGQRIATVLMYLYAFFSFLSCVVLNEMRV